jgi:hypothetical protein
MKRFEIGQRIDKGGVVFEITERTKKTVKFVEIQHAGRFNERRSEEKKKKIFEWPEKEIFYTGCYEVEA